MAVIRRHWLSGVLTILIIATVVGTILTSFPLRRGQVSQARADQAVSPPALDDWTRGAVAGLRSDLCLTNQDLAALGCSQELSELVLTDLVTWCQANKEALEQAASAERDAKRNLREVFRKINVGPAEPANTSQLAVRNEELNQAVQSRRDLVTQATTPVNNRLSQEQRSIWQTAQANQGAPGRYRYAPLLQASQMAAIKLAMRRAASDASALATAEDQTLSGVQKLAMAAAASNQNSFMDQVSEANAKVLPPPTPEEGEAGTSGQP